MYYTNCLGHRFVPGCYEATVSSDRLGSLSVEHVILPPVRLWQHVIHKGTEDHLTNIDLEFVVKLSLEGANVT